MWVLISSILDFVNLLPLYTVVSKKVISCFDSPWSEFEEVVEFVGSMKEVCYVFFSCVLPYHEAIVSVSDVGYYFVFVGRVCDQVFQYLVETYVADFW